MTSQNNSIESQRGSALIVTILLVSVLLVTALILLQRIIPYAKSVRSMHDASQAYYVARGEVDMARLEFFYGNGGVLGTLSIPSLFRFLSINNSTFSPSPATKRGHISLPVPSGSTYKQLTFDSSIDSGIDPVMIGLAFSSVSGDTDDHVVISGNLQNPLQVKLFPTDLTIKNFGTSKTNQLYHTLYSRNAGGLRFDLRGVETSDSDFSLKLKFPMIPSAGKITMKMQYFDKDNTTNSDVQTFANEYSINAATTETVIDLTDAGASEGNVQSIDSSGKIGADNMKYRAFLMNNADCSSADICSISFFLSGNTNQSLDFQLISSAQIPDLNAVVIGDGLSGNGLYYQRIIDLIPTPQDI